MAKVKFLRQPPNERRCPKCRALIVRWDEKGTAHYFEHKVRSGYLCDNCVEKADG